MDLANWKPTDRDLMESIRVGGQQRETAWHWMTIQWGGYLLGTTMRQWGCNEAQVREAFSVACVGVDARIRRAADLDFLQKASLKTYLTQATIHAAGRMLKTKQKPTAELDLAALLATEDAHAWQHSQDCTQLLDLALGHLSDRCKKILRLFNDGFSMEEIGREMGFKNADVARREKHECQVRFKAYLKANPTTQKQLIENCYG